MKYQLNVRKDEYDSRDLLVAKGAASPGLVVSFRSEVPYIKDQGQEGSCTAHAGTEHLELGFRKHKSNLSRLIDRSTLRFSPQFQYAQERIAEGDFLKDAGADSRTIFRVLASTGCCLESTNPYDDTKAFVMPTAAQVAEAKQYRVQAYHRIPDVDTAKTVLESGYSFTIGIPLYPQFQTDDAMANGLIAMPKGSSIGGHEMHVIGADDSIQVHNQTGAFEVQNSWGPKWGLGGFCWIPYAYMNAELSESDMWVSHFGAPWHPSKE